MTVPTHALSLIEPWATLMVIDDLLFRKKVETRDWSTPFRGPFAIHASKKLEKSTCREEPFLSVLKKHFGRWDFLDGTSELLHCERTEDLEPHQSQQELAFGDYGPRRFGFVCYYAERLRTPIPCRGMLGFWRIPDDVREQLAREMERAA